jgi:hypothetical protein
LVKAVCHWLPYLWTGPFVVHIDHYSLKYLLDQRLSTILRHAWVSKLFGFQFTVEFKPGHLNAVVDALPRRDEEAPAVLSISAPTFELFDQSRSRRSRTRGEKLRPARWTSSDQYWMTWSSTTAGFSCRRHQPCGQPCWKRPMVWAMKVFRKRSSICAPPSTRRGTTSLCGNTYEAALSANATRQSTFIRWGCCSCFRSRWRFGWTSRWPSLKTFQGSMASPWC